LNDFLSPITKRQNGVSALEAEHKKLGNDIDRITKQISDYRSFSQDETSQRIKDIKQENSALMEKVAEYDSRKNHLEKSISDLSKSKAPALKVWQYFSSDQSKLRLKISTHKEELSIIKSRTSDASNRRKNNDKEIEILEGKIAQHNSTNIEELTSNASRIVKRRLSISKDIQATQEELLAIDSKVGHLIKERHSLAKELREIEDDINQAEKFNKSLSNAYDKKQKWEIHQLCNDRFGEGQPNKVIKSKTPKRDFISRGINKLESRISEELAKFDRTVNAVVIDGNNMCYDSENNFIALSALRKVVHALKDRYAVTVVFDPGITQQLRANRDDIAKNLGRGVSTYIAPQGDTADSYILHLADNKPDTYVISNDIYTDYPDHECVKSKRIFGSLIANGQAIVRGLDINEAYQ
jgi:DNA repair exonuclease SbcCD ATPase subunit